MTSNFVFGTTALQNNNPLEKGAKWFFKVVTLHRTRLIYLCLDISHLVGFCVAIGLHKVTHSYNFNPSFKLSQSPHLAPILLLCHTTSKTKENIAKMRVYVDEVVESVRHLS